MALAPFLRLNSCILLFLLFLCSSSISCFRSKWENCSSAVNRCGKFTFSYPFGKKHSGCGDLDFQVECDSADHHPLLNIRGKDYQILQPYMLGNNSINHGIMIVEDNLLRKDNCTFFYNYTQPWWYDYKFFQIAHGYTNLTFWSDCSSAKNYTSKMLQLIFCGHVWYSFSSETGLNMARFCKTQLQLPIKREALLHFNKSIDNLTFIAQGFEVTWLIDPYRYQHCGACLMSKGICGHNKSTNFLCYCQDGTSQPEKCHGGQNRSATRGQNRSAIIIGCSNGGAVLTALAVVLFSKFYEKNRRPLSSGFASGFNKYNRKDKEAAELSGLKISNLPIFSYEELCLATNCFHEENEVGDGGFGLVYLGKLGDGRSVAVKRLYHDNVRRVEQFVNEVKVFSTLNHPHVVRLYGCAYEDSPELLLVYEFVSNGTLADHLHGHRRGPEGLPWNTRLNIAIQTAQALAFLHSLDPPVFHRDVKSSNILLDKDFNVKVADFGLSRLMPDNASHVTTAAQGTPGYVDPEYYQCYQLTEKSDVYSFGVVLVEIISGKLAVDLSRNGREINLANMAISKIQEGALYELVDRQLQFEMNEKVKVMVSAVAELAFRCLVSERDDRTHMNGVVAQLEQIRQSQVNLNRSR